MTDKLYIKTFGCQMNEYDSDRVADLLQESHGMVLTDDPEEANVLLLNTCSIREKAQEKVFSQLGRWRNSSFISINCNFCRTSFRKSIASSSLSPRCLRCALTASLIK